jgi:hypothetical protein
MKLTLLFTFIGFYAFSQKLEKINQSQMYHLQFSHFDYDTKRIHYMNNSNALKNNVKEFFKYETNKKGEKVLLEYRMFNKKGLLLLDSSKYRVLKYSYIDTLLTKIENSTLKSTLKTEFKYNEKHLISSVLVLRNGIKISEDVYTYNEFGKNTEIKNTLFSKKGKTTIYRLEREYDSNGKMSKEKYYENEVLKRTWNYECNEKGTLNLASNKQVEMTTSVCQFEEEVNDGSYKLFKRVISNGIVYLYEKQYSKDSVLLLSKTFLKENQLVSEVYYEKNRVTNIHYTKGKKFTKTSSFFDEKGNMIAYIYYNKKGKEFYNRQMFYNKKNLLEKEISRNRYIYYDYTYY